MPGTEQKSNQAPTTVTDSLRDLTELARAPVKILLSTPPVDPERDLTSLIKISHVQVQLVKVEDSFRAVAMAQTDVSQIKGDKGDKLYTRSPGEDFDILVKAEVALGQAQVVLEDEVKRTSPKDKEAVLEAITHYERLATLRLEMIQAQLRPTESPKQIEQTEYIQAAKREVEFLKSLQKSVATEKPLASAAKPKHLDQVKGFSDSAADVSRVYGLVARLAGDVRIYHVGRPTDTDGSPEEADLKEARRSLAYFQSNMEKRYRALDRDAQPAALVALQGERLLAEGTVRGLSTLDFKDQFVRTQYETSRAPLMLMVEKEHAKHLIKAAAMLIVAREQTEYFQNVHLP